MLTKMGMKQNGFHHHRSTQEHLMELAMYYINHTVLGKKWLSSLKLHFGK